MFQLLTGVLVWPQEPFPVNLTRRFTHGCSINVITSHQRSCEKVMFSVVTSCFPMWLLPMMIFTSHRQCGNPANSHPHHTGTASPTLALPPKKFVLSASERLVFDRNAFLFLRLCFCLFVAWVSSGFYFKTTKVFVFSSVPSRCLNVTVQYLCKLFSLWPVKVKTGTVSNIIHRNRMSSNKRVALM